MISNLTIKNFKCFEALSLPLAPLTVMTGFNAAGKSTSIQTLLLLAQSVRVGGESRMLPLNGPLTQLGSPGDVIREGGAPEIFLGVHSGKESVSWKLIPEDRHSAHTLSIKTVDWTTDFDQSKSILINRKTKLKNLLPQSSPLTIKNLCSSLKNTIFVSAVRAGVQEVFPAPYDSEPIWADVGMLGEYATWWFEENMDEAIDPSRLHKSDESPLLRRQLNAWAGELFPGAQANAQRLGNTRLVQLELRNHDADKWRRPANIGYGLTYAFPILVAGLLARKGQILIIDSPEAHLHPMGQSRIGIFLAMLAASGVQVIIETHSDHVLNGVRLAIKRSILTPEQIAIHFFNPRPRSADDIAHVISPLVDKNGNLSEWPSGFFDQAEKDLATLAGWD